MTHSKHSPTIPKTDCCHIDQWQQHINHQLQDYLSLCTTTASPLVQAMGYCVLNGGKRIRPLLVYATGKALGATHTRLDPVACAVELIHNYSLVHDDLPAMDNDLWRRGQPSCHQAYGEAIAILTGDALQSLAFEIIAKAACSFTPLAFKNILLCLTQAIGYQGMAKGQAMELILETASPPSIDTLKQIYQLKTGTLIQASLKLGALCANCMATPLISTLNSLGEILGLIFQLQDDLLDTATTSTSSQNQAINHVTLMGREATQQTIQHLEKKLWHLLDKINKRMKPAQFHALTLLFDYILQRNN